MKGDVDGLSELGLGDRHLSGSSSSSSPETVEGLGVDGAPPFCSHILIEALQVYYWPLPPPFFSTRNSWEIKLSGVTRVSTIAPLDSSSTTSVVIWAMASAEHFIV